MSINPNFKYLGTIRRHENVEIDYNRRLEDHLDRKRDAERAHAEAEQNKRFREYLKRKYKLPWWMEEAFGRYGRNFGYAWEDTLMHLGACIGVGLVLLSLAAWFAGEIRDAGQGWHNPLAPVIENARRAAEAVRNRVRP